MFVPASTIPVLAVAIPRRRRCYSGSRCGAASDPPFLVEKLPRGGVVLVALSSRAEGRLQPAPAAPSIPAGRPRTRPGRVVLDADEGIEPPLPEAALDLVGQLPDVGEPEGLRRAEGGLLRPRDAGDHNGAPLRQERTGAGVRGRRPRPSVAPAAAREAGGSEGGRRPGRRPPRQSPVFNTGYAGLPAKVALVTAVSRAHGGVAVVMPATPNDAPSRTLCLGAENRAGSDAAPIYGSTAPETGLRRAVAATPTTFGR